MIAKLVTHAPTRAEAIDAQADALDAFVHRRHPPQHSVPLGADGASALARRQAFHRLHRRGISRRLPCRIAPEGERAQVLASVAAAIDHVLGERKRQISGQMTRAQRHARKPAARSGSARPNIGSRSSARTAPSRCAFRAKARTRRAICNRTGSRAIRCGPAPSTASRSRCRCARLPNGFALAYPRRRGQGLSSIPRARPAMRG